MLTREKYLQLRADGQSRTHIQRNYFPSNPTKFYALLSEWGIKEKDAEERVLDLMPAEKLPTNQEKPESIKAAALVEELAALKQEITAFQKERESERAENERLLRELDEKQKLIEQLQAAQQPSKIVAEEAGDPVDHPAHYTAGAVECIVAIEAATTGLTGGQAYSTGAAIKYLWRWSRKGGVEDLRKARWYIDRLIAELEGNGNASRT
ncbi:DUF3310 domain-containing protein [Brevibacillus agri]